jgi:hypothetical protein
VREVVVAVFERRHVAVADEEAVEAAVDDDVVGEVVAEGEDEHGHADARHCDDAGHPIGEGDELEVAGEDADVGEDHCEGEDDGEVADGEGSSTCVGGEGPW